MYTVEHLSKEYPGRNGAVRALRDVTLTIRSGELISIQGPTGGGKSTLLQILGALDRPTRGRVLFQGKDLATSSDRLLTAYRARHVGFVFQSFNLIPTLTARENVESALVPLRVPARERRVRALDALEQLGVGDRRDHLPAELSGGQQQRVAIARAIVKRPSILLADEPTGNLDGQTRDAVLDALSSIRRSNAITTVIVTHDDQVARRAERRLRVQRGEVTAERGS
ncbi:ABC transporter ATP-binding protein [Microbacterium sp. NPDC058345]|uniref:ABC transporter ATP-binding protein n=1 Tax=Microbacterium sp. NPDC058345 TaxID=3346455 RepID=UPI0036624288